MLDSLRRLLKSRPGSVEDILSHPDGRRYYREQHILRREKMDPDALKVINRLNRNGYRSYLVGGCVRDMLLERRPKDYDVVTTATPGQIRNLFSNSRAIGKRFKIVHVVFRGKIIEVSTFRDLPGHRLAGGKMDKDLMMHRDNQYGSPREDAARRDFTINALFFDPRNESIIDYVGGFDDIANRRISVIGQPDISFKEDPVRMLRAAKFAALLDFEMDDACKRAVKKHRQEIMRASPPRMMEEYSKIFRTGKARKIFKSFYDTLLLKSLLPETSREMKAPAKNASFEETSLGKRLEVADRMLTEREDLTINIFWSLIFADLVKDALTGSVEKHIAEFIKKKLNPVFKKLQIPGKDQDRLLQMFAGQHRFAQTSGGRNFKPEFFKKKIFFYEAFMLYKINAIAAEDEDAQQKAMFWEIGLRKRPPESGKTISIFGRSGGGGRRKESGPRNKTGRSGEGRSGERRSGEGRSGEGRSGEGRSGRKPRGRPRASAESGKS